MIYPLIKSYGMTVLKSPEDPLQGVSKLNFMIIMSSTQVVLPSFYPTMLVDDEWKKLSPEKLKLIEDELNRSMQSSAYTYKTKSPVASEFNKSSDLVGGSIENLMSTHRVNSEVNSEEIEGLSKIHLDVENNNYSAHFD